MDSQVTLIKRFQKYLDKEFKLIPDTKEAIDFRLELMDTLMCHALDLKEKGMADDDVYVTCIASLGDYSETLKEIAQNPLDIIKDSKFWLKMLYAAAYSLIMVILYIGISFITGKWGMVAVIIFPILFLSLYLACSAIIINRNIKLKKHITTGLFIFGLEIICIIGLYFILSFTIHEGWFSPGRAWSLFVFIFPAAFVAELINKIFFRKEKKIKLPLCVGLIISMSVAIYLFVATIINAYHPYWLIILLGICISIIIMIISLTKKIQNKR